MSLEISRFAQSIGGSTIVSMRRKADAIAASGIKVIDFGPGEPDFDVPAPIAEAAIRAIEAGHSHYIDPRGLPELRQQVARFEADQHNLSVDPDCIVITTGTFGALSIVSRAILNPGDEVIFLEPLWDPYRNVILLTGATPVGVPMPKVDGRFEIDADRITSAVTPRTKAIVVNTPWNPTGRVLNREELVAIANVAIERDLWIVADEVYSEIVFDEAEHISIASLGPDIEKRTIVTTSLSKSFALTGWRIGYCIAPPELSQVLGRLNHYTTRGAASMVQHAAIAALTDGMPHVLQMRKEYMQRRNIIVPALNQVDGIVCPVPEGGFFAFPEFPEEWGDSTQLSDRLLSDSGIVVTPGSDYGACARHHLRISFATSQEIIQEGMSRLQDALTGQLDQ